MKETKCRSYGLYGVLATAASCSAQVPPSGQPGRTKRDAKDTSGLLVVAPTPRVGIRSFVDHHGIAPIDLVHPLGVDALGFEHGRRAFASHNVSAFT